MIETLVELLIILIFALSCLTVIAMILSYKEVCWFAKEMFTRIIKEYDKKHTAEYKYNKSKRVYRL